ncbi:MAG: DUF4400 domain-containing protein [Halothiobacillus sp.]|jgi:hypothetical protein|nr:DUF4400 domain-containing protein [Halothiobacillus sp.]
MANGNKDKLGKHRLIFAIFLVQIFIVLMFNVQPYVMGMLHYERMLNTAVIGPASEQDLKDAADKLFAKFFVDTGAYDASIKFAASTTGVMTPNSGMLQDSTNALAKRMQTGWLIVWIFFYRLIGAVQWLILVIPAAVALLVEALYFREIRKWKYVLTSPTMLDASKAMSSLFWVGMVYGLVAPFPAPGWVLAIFVVITLIAQRSRIENTEKRV